MGNKIRKKKSGLSHCESHESSEGGYYTPTVDSATELAPPSDRCVVLCVRNREGEREKRERGVISSGREGGRERGRKEREVISSCVRRVCFI